ncbi:ABC transporter permease [Varunaivibrio sulfuroxidans]|uniref:Putative spermidine/putrescine transport system permease protein n=1 Tax=Varunaivibrio sulfuroxidans TaxID=1773489 RepID=A0A4R3J6D6_9PROT|nr:ABC transporter permease [Varunaivibrio sulfuroxidans]TCS60937.1 putative spermidine/putrescine transport system permease protein [Varunaivibrio sulfuroxidans]WES31655.1 ABC transporter permease [Varunaivibrio sulfuroxidans]
MDRHGYSNLVLLGLPGAIVFLSFFIFPMVRLFFIGAGGAGGLASYAAIITTPRYLESLLATLTISIAVTFTALAISTTAGLFLVRHRFWGRDALVSVLTLPLAFPGVVIGFFVIMLGGRQGVVGEVSKMLSGDKIVFAYSMTGLFVGYLYFSIPRVILTVMATAEKLDRSHEEAARSLGAPPWRVIRDIVLPGLRPGLIASGAICFATAMGAFGTAFTLATNIDVLAMTIYTEFTLNANIAGAASLSIVLGLITWAALFAARGLSGGAVAVSG